MKDLAIVVVWVQALVHIILKGCGLQVIEGANREQDQYQGEVGIPSC
jgi:hypothetical protein